MSTKRLCVWVYEIGVLHATQNRVSHWEVWSAHTTRADAIKERDRPRKKYKFTRAFKKATSRIRKYVPAPNEEIRDAIVGWRSNGR